MQLIKNPDFVLRARVESDTLSDIDFQAEKQDRMEYMMTITNYLKETAGLIQNDPLLGPFLMQLLQFSLAGFKIGKKFEGELDKTFNQILAKLQQPPPPPQPTPEQQKVQGQLQLMQAKGQQDAQAGQQKLQIAQQEGQQKLQFKQADHQLKIQGKQQDLQVKQASNEQAMQNQAMKDNAQQQQMWHRLMADKVRAGQQAENAAAEPPNIPSGVGRG